ncbi:MAG: serine--tRNA ligase, partial [Roseomonas sp.]|nr:serine--tRNA ligase [Roseomonas sp.]
MHDIRQLRADPAAFDAALARRGLPPKAQQILEIDVALRKATTEFQAGLARKNALSRAIGIAMAKGDQVEAERLKAEVEAIVYWEGHMSPESLDALLRDSLETLPNILDAEVPDGRDESANLVQHQHGTPPEFPFTPKQHFELGEALGLMDFTTAAKLAGARFTVLKGALARLERALGQWMLNLHTEAHGYTESAVPLLVNDGTMYGTGQLPKFAEDLFRTTDGRWLIPTAEVPLTNFAAQE